MGKGTGRAWRRNVGVGRGGVEGLREVTLSEGVGAGRGRKG